MIESRFLDPEDEAFNDIERMSKMRKAAVESNFFKSLENNPLKDREDKAYDSGWNSALEMAATRIEHNFRQAFGADTLSSISTYIRGMKK